jgi:RNA polymerase sigma-70 factor (ECF subfamily)
MIALVRAFQGEVGSAAVAASDEGAALEKLLASFYARGREAYPRVLLDEALFGRHLARCANDAKAGSLSDVPAADLYLACACAARVPGAVAAFERKFGPVIRRAISRLLKTADDRQEAEQRVWHRLFVEDGQRPPRITQYLGRGPLENWVSVASMRIAVSFLRAESAEQRLRTKVIVDTAGVDPERLLMKGELRRPFETAVTEALGRMSPRERMILKLHVVGGVTLEAIGKSLGVTRQALSKTFSRCRERILGEVEGALKERFNLSPHDISSMLPAVASQLDASLSRALENPGARLPPRQGP